MENYPNNNNNNHLLILDPMPLRECPPSSDHSSDSSSSSTRNVEPSFISSVTPLRNNRMYDPKMNRLTAVKRLARNRGKAYPKYGPYPCQWCPKILPTSQSLAGHMRAHYRRIETAARKAAKQAEQQQQQQQQQHENDQEQQQAEALANAHARAMEQPVKSRTKSENLARLLVQINARAEAKERRKLIARGPVPAEALAPAPTPTPTPRPAPAPAPTPTPRPAAAAVAVASGSGKQPLRTNNCHLRLSNCQYGQIISPGNKTNSVSTESISNARDFSLYTTRRPIIPNSSSDADVLHYHHNLQVPPGLASSSRSRPSIDVNKKPPPVVVKQEVLFLDEEDVKPPPGFHYNLLPSEGPHNGGRFIIKEERVEFDDDEMVAWSLALKL